ncbi:hypothetical protein [Ruminococcus sp.]|uniref:hypothetical protein n=1 Tax=Ruminococcus sp. TaxID=41978 RepID=UPI00388F74BE
MTDSQNASSVYADIINLPHHKSATRPHMSLYDRAAQFAPFAALSGYEDMVRETARQTDSEIELSDNEKDIINGVLTEIAFLAESGAHPTVSVTYFIPDSNKQGGRYETYTGMVKKVDTFQKELVFYGSGDIKDKRTPTKELSIERIFSLLIQIPSDSGQEQNENSSISI